jgi:HPt (histidine-containing phosphotransfer) domain-containing protein
MRGALGETGYELLTPSRQTAALGGETGCSAMIDWKRVEELKEEVGADGFVEVADMFLDEADGAVRALVAGLPAEEVEGQLHFLKGSALNLGLSDLAAICQEGERKAAAGQGAAVDTAQVAAIWHASRLGLLGSLSPNQAGAA